MTDPSSIDRPKSPSARPLVALIPFIRPYLARLVLALIALGAAAGALLAFPVAVRHLIDAGLSAENAASIDRYFILMFGVAIAFGLFVSLRMYLVMWLGERVVADIRDAVYRHVIRMDPAFFEVTQTGEVLSRLTADTTLVQSIAGVGISITLRAAVTLAGGLIMLAITSPSLTAVILVLVPVVIVPIILIGRRVRTAVARNAGSRCRLERARRRNAECDPDGSGVYAGEADRASASPTRSMRLSTAVRRIRTRALLTALAILTIFGAITLVLWLGRAGRARTGDDRGRTGSVRHVRDLRCRFGGLAQRDVGRSTTSRWRHRTPHGTHDGRAGIVAPLHPRPFPDPVGAKSLSKT